MRIGKFDIGKLELISISIALAILLPMLVGIALRIHYFNEANFPGQGECMVINDPGKIFFHVMLLPIIAYALVKFAPYGAFRAIIRRKGTFYTAIAIVVFFLYTILSITLNDLHGGFCGRNPTPDNFKSPEARKIVAASWVKNHNELADILRTASSGRKSHFARLNNNYKETCRKFAPANCPYSRSFFIKPSVFSCYYFSQSSVSSNLDGLLTFFALLCGIFLLCTLFAHIINRKDPTLQQISALRLVLIFVLMWFPLRWYSEWYINFGDIGEGSQHFSNKYPEIGLAILLVILLLVLTSVITQKTKK